MDIWEIEFFPLAGIRLSPIDALYDLCNVKEQVYIKQRLRVIRELHPQDWPRWVKLVSGVYQLTSGDFRIYFFLVDRTIVVTHICRKVTQKAKDKDLRIAKDNFKKYTI